MEIVLVEPELADNGAMRVSLDRAQRWAAAGHGVTLLVVDAHVAESEVELPPGVAVVRATSVPRRLRYALLAAVARAVVLARRADVVVAGRELGDGLLCAAAAARVARRPLAVTVQSRVDQALASYVPGRRQDLNRRALRSAQLAVCVATGLVPVLERLGLSPDTIRVVTNGVDAPAVRRAALEEPGVPLPTGPVVVGVGRLHPQKGFDLLVRAHAQAREQGAPAHTLVLLGEGPQREQLEELTRELGVEETVRLPGFVSNPHAVLARAELLALPSRWEGYPLTLVEALVLGVPTIAADCVSGPREVLQEGAYGELVPVEDAAALGQAITRHLREPERLRARARLGQQGAEAAHEPGAAAAAHLRLLQQLVDRGGPGYAEEVLGTVPAPDRSPRGDGPPTLDA